jgi:hypothetical protein
MGRPVPLRPSLGLTEAIEEKTIMGSFNARLHGSKGSPKSYEAVVAVVKGGTLVVPSTAATSDPSLEACVTAGDAAVNVLGVAAKDAVPVALRAGLQSGTTAYDADYPTFDYSVPDSNVTVYDEVEGYMQYTGACAYNAPICAAAGGNVRALVVGTDAPLAKIGRCTQPGGVTAAGRGLANLRCI